MTENTVNVPLLRKAVEWAEAEAAKPRELCEWQQSYYVLPTTWPEAQASGIQVQLKDWWQSGRQALSPECGTAFCIAGFIQHELDGSLNYNTAHSVAKSALILSASEAAELFSATNNITDVRRIAEDLAGERL